MRQIEQKICLKIQYCDCIPLLSYSSEKSLCVISNAINFMVAFQINFYVSDVFLLKFCLFIYWISPRLYLRGPRIKTFYTELLIRYDNIDIVLHLFSYIIKISKCNNYIHLSYSISWSKILRNHVN